ncbi:MAG: putative metalloprotease CJM1_0395 family protein [Thermodesulfobacteriota bacterium]
MAGRRGDAGMAPDTAPPAAETGEGAATENSSAESASRETMAAAPPKGADGEPLTPQEVALLMELKKADAAVRAHEQAHLAAAGGLAKGGANFSYRKGPDGRRYAVAGEVGIDTSKGATPEETISRMARVRAAALAPADPSPQDRKVAQAAAMSMSEARGELRLERMEKEGATDVADANAEQSESTSGAAAATTTEQSGSAVSVRGYSVMPSLSRREGAFYRLA